MKFIKEDVQATVDIRQQSIVFQNAMAHATKILIHNKQLEGEPVYLDEVLAMAREIAKIAVEPKL